MHQELRHACHSEPHTPKQIPPRTQTEDLVIAYEPSDGAAARSGDRGGASSQASGSGGGAATPPDRASAATCSLRFSSARTGWSSMPLPSTRDHRAGYIAECDAGRGLVRSSLRAMADDGMTVKIAFCRAAVSWAAARMSSAVVSIRPTLERSSTVRRSRVMTRDSAVTSS